MKNNMYLFLHTSIIKVPFNTKPYKVGSLAHLFLPEQMHKNYVLPFLCHLLAVQVHQLQSVPGLLFFLPGLFLPETERAELHGEFLNK